MTLHYHLYELHSAAPLGARTCSAVRHGALLRTRMPDGAPGYADCHPWAELGDLPLGEQLQRLARGETTDLTRASLAFAAMDAQARVQGRSLWDGLIVPPSHCLLPGLGEGGWDALEAAFADGFTHIKVKVGRDIPAETRRLRDLSGFLASAALPHGARPRLRLDCNEALAAAQFADTFGALGALKPFLDFVEDPCPFDAAQWDALSTQTGIAFAVDRAMSEDATQGWRGVQVHKPARSGPAVPARALFPHSGRTVVTSYLDHPLGQLCAAWVAARLPPVEPRETHGLVSHRVYAPTPFSERLGGHGPVLDLPGGTGFGFDDELGALDWSSLT